MVNKAVERAKEHFGKLLEEQIERVERMKEAGDWIDFAQVRPIIIGIIGGDGIGPYIAREAERVLRFLLEDELAGGRVEFRTIEGLTIENRARAMKTIPDDIMREIKQCHVISTSRVPMWPCDASLTCSPTCAR